MLVATPNIAVDRVVRLAALRPGSVLRTGRARVAAGGKGVNVGRARAAYGHRATLVGFQPSVDADLVRRLMSAEPVDFVGVPVAGEVRVATIHLEESGRVTVLNEPGPDIDPAGWSAYEDAIADALAIGRHRTLVCSGSLPPGAPDDGYGRLVGLGHGAGVRVVVDAARGALGGALAAGPDLVVPNLAEAAGYLRVPGEPPGAVHVTATGTDGEAVDECGPDVADRAVAAARRLCRRGARAAVVTAGAAGAAYACGAADGPVGADHADGTPYAGGRVDGAANAGGRVDGTADAGGRVDGAADAGGVTGGGTLWVPAPVVHVVNPIGAGDAFAAGLVEALESGGTPGVAVVFAVATAAASVERERPGDLDPVRARALAADLAARVAPAPRVA